MKQGQKGRNIYNKLVVLSQVMKQHGRPKLLKTSDWPKFVETVRPIYKDFDLARLFKACTPFEEVRFKFYLVAAALMQDSVRGLLRKDVTPITSNNY
jgi:hypothetical protein